MATVGTRGMTADEFWEWCQLPENAGKRVELERGEIVEVPPPVEDHGLLCGWISQLLWQYVLGRGGGGGVATNDMGLVVEEDPATVRGPDVVLFGESQPLGQGRKHSRRIPKLVVEVLSPSDKPNKVTRRIGEYLGRGVPLVWIVDIEDRTVGVHRKGELPRTLDEGDEITGDDVLPELKYKVAELFTLPGTKPAP